MKLQRNSENARKNIRKTDDKKTKHFLGRTTNPTNAASLHNPKRGRWRNINKEKKNEKQKKISAEQETEETIMEQKQGR